MQKVDAFPVAIALDTKGPEIRTGLLEGVRVNVIEFAIQLIRMLQGASAEIELKKGATIRVTTNESFKEKGNLETIWLDYKNITKVVKPGMKVYVDDGLISLIVKEIRESLCDSLPFEFY